MFPHANLYASQEMGIVSLVLVFFISIGWEQIRKLLFYPYSDVNVYVVMQPF